MVIKSNTGLNSIPGVQERSALWQAFPQILATCVKNVLLLGFGMTLGFPTILIPSLSAKAGDTNETFSLGQEAISWIGSINLICVPVGCLLSGAITQPIGRKRAMQFVNLPFLAAWLLFYYSTEVWHVFLALALTGMSGGLLEAPVITYVAEITQPKLRGILSSTSTIAVMSGVLIQYFLGTFLPWRVVALVSSSVSVISTILLFFIPESPHWLISKNRLEEAQQNLAWLRGWTSVEQIQPEYLELYKQIGPKSNIANGNLTTENKSDEANSKSKQRKLETLRLYTKKTFLKPYLLISFAFFLAHFTGTTSLTVYAVKIFSTLKTPINQYYATIFLGVGGMLGCILSACAVHYFGKRGMNLFSLLGCGISFVTVATYAYMHGIKYISNDASQNSSKDFFHIEHTHQWIPMIFLIGASFFTHAGIRILPWMLIGEVYPSEIRASASGMTGSISYVFGFIVNKVFLSMVSSMTLPGTYWFYGCISFLGAIVLYFVLPETEGKTLFEITEHFADRSKLTNKVYNRKDHSQSEGVDNSAFDMEEKEKSKSEIETQKNGKSV